MAHTMRMPMPSASHENLDGSDEVNCADREFSQSDLRHQAHVAGGNEE